MSSSLAMPFTERTIGKYVLRGELGRGGMGVVYLAVDTQLDREVALKMVRPGVFPDAKSIERFRREARAVGALSHPHIVHVNAFDQIDDTLLIEMPYLRGGSLHEAIVSGIPLVRLVRIMEELLDALRCCHGAGVIHRDVKPSNVLLDERHASKLSDFGAAALLEGSWEAGMRATASSVVFVGTPQYACPEAWTSAAPEPHWDLYAVGMIAREALTGTPGIQTSSALEYLNYIAQNPLPKVADMNLPISPELAALVDWLTGWRAADRPSSAEEALKALRATPEHGAVQQLGKDTVETSLPMEVQLGGFIGEGAEKELGPALAKGRILYALAIVLLVVVGVVGAFYFGFSDQEGLVELPVEAAIANTGQPTPEERGDSDVYDWYAARAPEASGWLLLRNGRTDRQVEGLGICDGNLLRFSGTRDREGGIQDIEGVWASYADAAKTTPRYGRVQGQGVAWASDEQRFRLEVRFISETDPGHWQESFFAAASQGDTSGESLVNGLLAEPVWMRLLFGELLPRDIEDRFRFVPFIGPGTALTLVAQRGTTGVAPVIDGIPEESYWGERDSSGVAHAAAVLGSDGVYVAVWAPCEGQDAELHLDVFSATLIAELPENWRGIVVRRDGVEGPPGLEGAMRFDGASGQLTAELWLPFAAGPRQGWPNRDTALLIECELQEASGQSHYLWGGDEAAGGGPKLLAVVNQARLEYP